MKKHFLIILSLVVAVVAFADNSQHFISNAEYRNAVHSDFLKRQTLIQKAIGADYKSIAALNPMEREAVEFLYAYMPYNDIADYDCNFFVKQAQYAFKAKQEMPWGAAIPEDVFRHFVLPYRVNNENLDSARFVMFDVLKERLKGMSMYDAALEVNHWCHEYVTYRPADIRTSAPLATMRTGLGRCGEESTFTVTALRAAGIPARQCYTPRWAHCDDNHAWVEVWIDGKWMFLGACEPDPELNMGWFSIPSTRCMMVHTKAFGRYQGTEEVIVEAPYYSELNLLSHYAPTRHVVVTVLDTAKKPVANAEVKFKLYNYSEYYTLATFKTDAQGQASINSGMGDLLVWATDGKNYNYQKLDLRNDSALTLCLNRAGGNEYVDELDIFPPSASKAKVSPAKSKVVENTQRLAYEDAKRNARMATFMCNTPFGSWDIMPNANLNDRQLEEIIRKSEGNYAEIVKFLNNHTEKKQGLLLYDYLKSFSDKDLRDITASVLEHHVTTYDGKLPVEVYKKGIMPARVSNEMIVNWRNLPKYKAPAITPDGNYYNCPITPLGVNMIQCADAHSRDIYYVAACRAQGIPAYLDNATNEIYKWDGKKWQLVTLDKGAEAPSSTGILQLTYSGTEPKVPVYYPHFTLQKYEKGDFVSFDFEDDPRMSQFPASLELAPGYYCLSTGNRYPNGDVLSRMEFFNVEAGKSVTKEITLRKLSAQKAQALPSISPELKITSDSIALANYAGVKGFIYVNLGDYREPSKHLVNEMLQLEQSLEEWGGNLYIVTPGAAITQLSSFSNADLEQYNEDVEVEVETALLKALDIQGRPRYPFAAFINNTGQILYHTEGYSIGSAEQLLKVASQY